jgi:hypothetical protein
MTPDRPQWLELLGSLPSNAKPETKPVASAQQLADGTAGPIADWVSVSMHLSAPQGSRHVMVTLDGAGKTLSAGDHVMLVSHLKRDGKTFNIYEHRSVGGRYAEDGVFHGTSWIIRMEQEEGSDDVGASTSTPSQPTETDIAALNRIVVEVMARRGQ